MNTSLIKNIHLLKDLVSEKMLEKMEHAAVQHRRYSSFTFKIVEITDKKVVIQIAQGKSISGNYQPSKRMIEIVNDTFGGFFKDRKIIVNAVPYVEPKANQVTPEWIVEKMKETGTRLKTIADETGIDYPNLSTIVNGGSISQVMKALFWYYFESKQKNAA